MAMKSVKTYFNIGEISEEAKQASKNQNNQVKSILELYKEESEKDEISNARYVECRY